MPEPPAGEAGLRELASAFMGAEGYVLAMLAEAAVGDRQRMTKWALERLAKLRLLDFKKPVADAYLAENPDGRAGTVSDLAGSLALRLDRGAKTAADGVRDAFRKVTADNVDQLLMSPLTAAVDTAGKHWALGAWAEMNTLTIGRHATSRGLAHAIGEGGTFVVNIGGCQLCRNLFSGELTVGEDPMPPGHPSCDCVARPA